MSDHETADASSGIDVPPGAPSVVGGLLAGVGQFLPAVGGLPVWPLAGVGCGVIAWEIRRPVARLAYAAVFAVTAGLELAASGVTVAAAIALCLVTLLVGFEAGTLWILGISEYGLLDEQ